MDERRDLVEAPYGYNEVRGGQDLEGGAAQEYEGEQQADSDQEMGLEEPEEEGEYPEGQADQA